MSGTLRAEYRKIVTTRMWWLLLVCLAAYMVFLAAVMGFALVTGAGVGMGPAAGGPGAAPLDDRTVAASVYGLATSIGYVFPLVVGTLLVTNEFRHQTITPTLLADPSRTRVLAAKMVAALGVGVLYGVVGTAATVGTGAAAITIAGGDPLLGDAGLQRGMALSVLALAVWAAVGVGFGAAVPNQVAAVVVVLAFTQFVEPLLRIGLAAWEPTADLARFFPGAAGDAIAGNSLYAVLGSADLLSWWQGLLVLVAYAVALAALGRLTTLTRDVT